jgi:hypothetical protein
MYSVLQTLRENVTWNTRAVLTSQKSDFSFSLPFFAAVYLLLPETLEKDGRDRGFQRTGNCRGNFRKQLILLTFVEMTFFSGLSERCVTSND